MSGDQMSILVSGIKSPGIKCPGIKCPFWCWGSKVRGSNVHFRVRDQTSSGSNVYFMSGIKCPRDRMSSGSIVNPFYGIENPKSKVWGSKVRGSNVHHPSFLARRNDFKSTGNLLHRLKNNQDILRNLLNKCSKITGTLSRCPCGSAGPDLKSEKNHIILKV